MDTAKKFQNKLDKLLLIIYLVLFPFGQLLRFQTDILGKSIALYPTDLLVMIMALSLIYKKVLIPKIFKYSLNYILFAAFSLLVSLSFFTFNQVLISSLYLIRFTSYLLFFVYVWNLIKSGIKKEWFFNKLIIISFVVSILGIGQYLLIPDVRFLQNFGWDNHLLRIIGTFFDPGYTAIIITFGIILSHIAYLEVKNAKYLVLMLISGISLALTYSRAGYLSLAAAMIVLTYIYKKYKILLILIGFLLFLPFLPRPASEGARLERIVSIKARMENYQESIKIIKTSPLIGVGFNNLCPARLKIFGGNPLSHSCYGADSSILFVLATSGIVGLMLYLYMLMKLILGRSNNSYSKALLAASSALFVHSFFMNSLFYPWVMGYMAILLAISTKGDT
ncbi:MAG: hypothetical protein US60_C0021G0008 [Microgenomates group bacterium GW2011_GWC1_37_8]|uniref:O-antigen ligase-related domain-containing protein n=1 Tax=Candidatus Woesebacteria bacterium GW2011_GWB1_38_8 TaxID=1618570 RepID=A0A0G0L429_9BACT|nr:MAG: hypothetical protein US60_C0021G0008 [Microgenomates group bacterium GW2011_GWC1_37_8]KKQ85772.1 MAG: hypothetical protein UT08_C0004G0084 [Candidatus Woesebacteria bacterium GW2011_GWB1_38_8]